MSGRRRFGAIRKLPSGRFQVRFRDPETNLYRTAEQTFATKGDAGRWLSILEADLARGLWHDPKRGEVLLGEVAETWYSTKLHLRETTKHIYRVILDAHILPAFGEQPIGSITTLDVQVWIAALHQKPRCGPNTVAKTYKQLRTIMEMALDAGLIVRNPCRIKGAGTERFPEMRCATVEEVAALAQAVEPRWQALILLAAYSGLRWGELAGLRRRYLDPLHKTVRVVEQCTEVNGRFVWGPPKTAAGMRTVVLPSFICDVMVEHLARWSQPGVDGFVFVMPEGDAVAPRELPKASVVPGASRRRHRGRLRFHDLRHTNATLAAASGAPLRAVMHRLGHASAMAALRYQHRVEGQDEAIADFLDTQFVNRSGSTQRIRAHYMWHAPWKVRDREPPSAPPGFGRQSQAQPCRPHTAPGRWSAVRKMHPHESLNTAWIAPRRTPGQGMRVSRQASTLRSHLGAHRVHRHLVSRGKKRSGGTLQFRVGPVGERAAGTDGQSCT